MRTHQIDALNCVRRFRRPGFTLVELLVVIAILVVLISILLPSMKKAREQANSIQCLSNLRQQGAIILSYVSENEGRLPYFAMINGATAGVNNISKGSVWPTLAAEGRFPLGALSAGTIFRGLGGPGAGTVNDLYYPGFLICPDAPMITDGSNAPIPRGFTPGRFRNSATIYNMLSFAGADESSAVYGNIINPQMPSAPVGHVFADYSVNAYAAAYEPAPANTKTWPNLTIDGTLYQYKSPFPNCYPSANTNTGPDDPNYPVHVAHSSDTIMAFDCGTTYIDTWLAAVFRHPNLSCNFVFFDGHAENLRTTDLDGGAGNNGATNPGGINDVRLIMTH